MGLFGQLGATGSLEDLGVEAVAVEGNKFAGGLVGQTLGSATITSCHATGVVTNRSGNAGVLVGGNSGTITLCHATGTVTGKGPAGILVGENAASGTIRSCHSAGSAEGGNREVGGLVGDNAGTITSCYSTGSAVVGDASAGGLVGSNNRGTITSCYATGSATANDGSVGGLVGHGGTITSCYSTGAAQRNDGRPAGGLVGGVATVLDSFWDTDTSGITTLGAGTGKTTAEMKMLSLADLGDAGGLSWDVGTTDQYPAVKSYKEMPPGTQVEGDVLIGQPCPRAGVCNAFVGGTGTEGDPYQISTVKQLDSIRGAFLDDHFLLVNDLDFDGYVYSEDTDENAKGWLPIGHDTDKDTGSFQGTAFAGSFDGGGYVIRNLSISRADEDYVGLFGLLLTGSLLKDLGVEGVAVVGDERVGGLVGELSGTLRSCYAKGQVTGTEFVGGLLGYNDQGTVTSCYSTVSATASGSKAGGFMGHNEGTIRSCYSTGSVTGSGSSIGGFVGNNETTITSCYSTGAVTGGSAPGGFAGTNVGTVGDSFWDTGTSGITTSVAGTGKTTAEMKALTLTELGDIGGLSWDVGTMDHYPELKTYIENEEGAQVQGGDPLAGQSCPRSHCDPLVSIAVGFSPVRPVNEANRILELFHLTRTGPTVAELRVGITFTGSHHTGSPSREAVFPAGTATLIVVPRIENEMDEADWTLTVTLTEKPSSFRLENASASITVTDNDLPSITSFEIGENSGSIVEDADPKTITVTVPEGTSLVGLDPTVVAVRSDATVAPSGMVTFVDGTAQPYTVTAGGDTVTYQVTVNVVAGTPPGVPGGFFGCGRCRAGHLVVDGTY